MQNAQETNVVGIDPSNTKAALIHATGLVAAAFISKNPCGHDDLNTIIETIRGALDPAAQPQAAPGKTHPGRANQKIRAR